MKLSPKEKEEWLKKNKNLLGYWANRFKGYNTFENEELMSIATLGAVIGLDKYDTKHGTKINNYVTNYIRSELQQSVARMYHAVRKPLSRLKLSLKSERDESFEEFLDKYEEEGADVTNLSVDQKLDIDIFLNKLSPVKKRCSNYELGLENDLPCWLAPLSRVFFEVSLIELRRLKCPF